MDFLLDIKQNLKNKTFLFARLKVALWRGAKECDQTGCKVIDIPLSTHELCQKRAREDGEGGENGNVLLNVSNDHKHINHGAQRPLVGKWIRRWYEREGWRERVKDEERDSRVEEVGEQGEACRLCQRCTVGCLLVLYHQPLDYRYVSAEEFVGYAWCTIYNRDLISSYTCHILPWRCVTTGYTWIITITVIVMYNAELFYSLTPTLSVYLFIKHKQVYIE